ncbi:ATP-binding protein [Andreprevotia lacus]|nr:ATP-binding protein [Andreprevotia lacus]
MTTLAALGAPATRSATCPQHGDYTSRKWLGSIWSKCPQCSAAQAEASRHDAERRAAQASSAHWQQQLQQAAIPPRFLDRTLHNYQATQAGQQRALAFAHAYAAALAGPASGRSAIFSGERGTGKTHLAIGIAQQAMGRHGKTALFTTVQRYIRAVRDSWSRNSPLTESAVVALYARPDLLILDEIGVQAGSDNEKQLLFDLLNERYEHRRSTLLLTNLTVGECRSYLGERVFDRLREDGGEFVAFDWDSWRGRSPHAAP